MKFTALLPFLLITSLSFAQFPNIMWDYFTGAPAFGSAAAADMDDDGFYEIVFTTYTNDGRAHCLNAEDGSVKWTFDIGGCGDVAPIIYDMNKDGQLDVVINGSCNPTIYCLNGATGELIWSQPSGGGDSPPTVADIDNDNRPEVLFGNFNGEIRILNGEDGSLVKSIQATPFFNALQTEPTLVDVNNDERLDIIAANFFNDDGLYIWAFDFETEELLWTNFTDHLDSDFHAYHGGAVADIDNDGKEEYVIGSGSGRIQAINVEDGSELWTLHIPASNMSAISIANLDEDPELEVIFNNNDYLTFDERIWVVSGMDGTEEWSYPINFTSFRGMAISDINGNGQLDLVSGHFMGMVRIVEPYSGLIWEMSLREEFSPGLPYFEVDHGPLIADFDQNGTLDVFVVAGYGTYEPDSLNTGKAFMIEAGAGTCPEWLMFRHDIHRSGYLSAEEVEEACRVTSSEELDRSTEEIMVYPNPSTGNFTVEYFLNKNAVVQISLFNTLQQKVDVLENGHQGAGKYQMTFSLNDKLPSGIYFLELDFDNGAIFYKKIEVIKG